MEYHVGGGGLEERTSGEGGDGDLVGRDWEQHEMERSRTVDGVPNSMTWTREMPLVSWRTPYRGDGTLVQMGRAGSGSGSR